MAQETERLASFAANLQREAIPEPVVARAKLLLLDTLGIVIRARHDGESTPCFLAMARTAGLGGSGATVYGDSSPYGPAAAALLNGALAHSLDFDDTHAPGSLHCSAPVVPAALAAAELTGASGRTLMPAIVAGYAPLCRVAMALTPAAHCRRGFHPSATAGTFGAAAAAGRVLGLDAAGMANAFGACGSQAAGTMQFLANGSWNKRYQVGAAAMNGLMAALLAKNGFVGSSEALEGKQGFLNGYTSEPRPERLTERLGEKWETLEIAVKPYPSCRYSHAALDAILALRARHTIRPDEVRSLKVGLPKTGIDIIAIPIEAKRQARSIVEGQFSMPFLAAAAITRGRFGWADYDLVGDEAVDNLASRVEIWNDPACEAAFPAQMAGSVEIVTGRGTFSQMVACPKGEPANFVTDAELRAKFTGLAAAYLAPGTADAAIKAILGVEEARSLREVLRPALAAGRGASPAVRVAGFA